MKTAVLIPTRGNKPTFITQAQQLVKDQTLKPDKVYVVSTPPKGSGIDLLARLRAGVKAACADGVDRLYCWDDDDYYPPTYLAWMDSIWGVGVDMLGAFTTVYYHLNYRRYIPRAFRDHACLGCTAFNPQIMDLDGFEETYPFDTVLWPWAHQNLNVQLQAQPRWTVIGMKHNYVTYGANAKPPHYFRYADPDMSWLKQHLAPEHRDFYLKGGWNVWR